MIDTIFGYDATGANEHLLPTDVLCAGYDTQVGAGYQIRWTAAQFEYHSLPYPAIHYDQDPNASDYMSDLLDIEAGAATDSEIVRWITNARESYRQVKRPGQRWPGLYCSVSNVPGAVTVCHANNLTNVPFVVADYGVSQAEATRLVASAVGPYPAIGYQFTDKEFNGNADGNIFSLPWVQTMSGKGNTVTTPTPLPVLQDNWAYCTKCQGMFWEPRQTESHCPAGGTHEGGTTRYAMISLPA